MVPTVSEAPLPLRTVMTSDDNVAKLESDPEALKVREWRHKLQKTFLSSNKSLPKEEVRRFASP
jgi:hypothetical protein